MGDDLEQCRYTKQLIDGKVGEYITLILLKVKIYKLVFSFHEQELSIQVLNKPFKLFCIAKCTYAVYTKSHNVTFNTGQNTAHHLCQSQRPNIECSTLFATCFA